MFAKICSTEDAACFIETMRHQEVTGYQTRNYLRTMEGNDHADPCVVGYAPLNCEDQVNSDCRSRMVDWCFQVVNFCKYERETVEIAMSSLDRFLGTAQGNDALNDRKTFQLAAMTCLYTAIKVHEPEAIDPQMMSGLSRGVYSPKQFEAMELKIMSALQWRVNAPTSMSFVRFFMALLPDAAIMGDELDAISEFAKFQTEVAVGENSLVGVSASTIALAAIANALNALDDQELKCTCIESISETAKVDIHSHTFVKTRGRLWSAMEKEPHVQRRHMMPQSPSVEKMAERSSVIDASPRAVVSTR
ncbi:cyclin-like protein [Fragilaria crotonensis]|nr:cyclin-like protein [Fragilaria crotonensis]